MEIIMIYHSAVKMNAMHTKILIHWNAMHEIMKSNVKANSREGQEITHVLHVKFIPLISINNLEDFWICSKINIEIISVDCQTVMQHALVGKLSPILPVNG